jgi:CHAT domain-containing protein
MLMEHFYAVWHEGKLSPTQALQTAQQWVRDTTNGEKAEYFKRYSKRSSSLRMGEATALDFFGQMMSRNLDNRDFAHPFWWAAFLFHRSLANSSCVSAP